MAANVAFKQRLQELENQLRMVRNDSTSSASLNIFPPPVLSPNGTRVVESYGFGVLDDEDEDNDTDEDEDNESRIVTSTTTTASASADSQARLQITPSTEKHTTQQPSGQKHAPSSSGNKRNVSPTSRTLRPTARASPLVKMLQQQLPASAAPNLSLAGRQTRGGSAIVSGSSASQARSSGDGGNGSGSGVGASGGGVHHKRRHTEFGDDVTNPYIQQIKQSHVERFQKLHSEYDSTKQRRFSSPLGTLSLLKSMPKMKASVNDDDDDEEDGDSDNVQKSENEEKNVSVSVSTHTNADTSTGTEAKNPPMTSTPDSVNPSNLTVSPLSTEPSPSKTDTTPAKKRPLNYSAVSGLSVSPDAIISMSPLVSPTHVRDLSLSAEEEGSRDKATKGRNRRLFSQDSVGFPDEMLKQFSQSEQANVIASLDSGLMNLVVEGVDGDNSNRGGDGASSAVTPATDQNDTRPQVKPQADKEKSGKTKKKRRRKKKKRRKRTVSEDSVGSSGTDQSMGSLPKDASSVLLAAVGGVEKEEEEEPSSAHLRNDTVRVFFTLFFSLSFVCLIFKSVVLLLFRRCVHMLTSVHILCRARNFLAFRLFLARLFLPYHKRRRCQNIRTKVPALAYATSPHSALSLLCPLKD